MVYRPPRRAKKTVKEIVVVEISCVIALLLRICLNNDVLVMMTTSCRNIRAWRQGELFSFVANTRLMRLDRSVVKRKATSAGDHDQLVIKKPRHLVLQTIEPEDGDSIIMCVSVCDA